MPSETREKRAVRPWLIFKTYSTEILKFPWLFATVVFGLLTLQASELVAPLYFKQFFNILAGGPNVPGVMHSLLVTLAIIAGFSILSWAARRIQAFSMQYLESSVMATLYERAFQYLIGHSYNFFTSQFSGTLTRRVSKFAGSFEMLFDAFTFQFVPTTLFLVGAITILAVRNLTLGVILFVWTVVFVSIQIFFAKLRQPIRNARAAADSKAVGALSDAISNQNTIALFAGGAFETDRFRDTITSWRKATIRSWNTDEYVWTVVGFLMIIIEIALLYGAIHYWTLGLLTLGDFALIQAYLLGTFDRLVGLNQQLRRFYDSIADASEMIDILELPQEVQDAAGAAPLTVSRGAIALSDVDFYFNPETPVFEKFSLSIAGGEKVALVGYSGSGKSTITRLLLRFFDVQSGSVTIDGQDIRSVTQDSLRNAIAYVPQEPILFHRTLMENIRYGRRSATDAEVVAAAKSAHCHEFIENLSDGYDSLVGERGIKLSGGERQRVAIARAILKNAPILILDEATSSLDSESEALIQDALEKLMQGKTVIAIAHRLSTVMKMDRIIVMDHGTIVTSGTHSELLAGEMNLYQKLWNIQAGGFGA